MACGWESEIWRYIERMRDCLLVSWLENEFKDRVLSGASLCSPNHSLLDPLCAFEILEALFLKDVDIEFLHDLQHNIETFEEAIHRDTEHTICSGAVDSAEYGSIVFIRCRLCRLKDV